MATKDISDVIAEEIVDWIESMSTDIAEAILGSALKPMVVQPPRREALAYFRRYLWLPDGTPNKAGRDFLEGGARPDPVTGTALDPVTGEPSDFAGYGAQGYEAIALADAGEPSPLPTVPGPQEAY